MRESKIIFIGSGTELTKYFALSALDDEVPVKIISFPEVAERCTYDFLVIGATEKVNARWSQTWGTVEICNGSGSQLKYTSDIFLHEIKMLENSIIPATCVLKVTLFTTVNILIVKIRIKKPAFGGVSGRGSWHFLPNQDAEFYDTVRKIDFNEGENNEDT